MALATFAAFPRGPGKNSGLVQFRVTTWYFRFLDLVFSKLSVPPRLVCQITPVSWRKQTCAILSPPRPRGISKPLLLVPPRRWDLLQRQEIAVAALAGSRSITRVADEYDVSRKFVYGQVTVPQDALEAAFASPEVSDDVVLFYLPITKSWIKQCVLGLVFICHSSIRGVVEFCRDLLDYPISVCTLLNTVPA